MYVADICDFVIPVLIENYITEFKRQQLQHFCLRKCLALFKSQRYVLWFFIGVATIFHYVSFDWAYSFRGILLISDFTFQNPYQDSIYCLLRLSDLLNSLRPSDAYMRR